MSGGDFAAESGKPVRRVFPVAGLTGLKHAAEKILLQVGVPAPGRLGELCRRLVESVVEFEKRRRDGGFEVLAVLRGQVPVEDKTVMYRLGVLRHRIVVARDQRGDDLLAGLQDSRHFLRKEFLQFGRELGGDRLGAADMSRGPRAREQRDDRTAENGAEVLRCGARDAGINYHLPEAQASGLIRIPGKGSDVRLPAARAGRPPFPRAVARRRVEWPGAGSGPGGHGGIAPRARDVTS